MSNTLASLNDRMEFDHPVRIGADGTVSDAPGVYAPSVFAWEDMGDDPYVVGSGWSFFSRGYTGQYGVKRSNPIMHASEFVGGRLADDILSTPGVYVVVAVEDDDDPDSPWGWVVLRKDGES